MLIIRRLKKLSYWDLKEYFENEWKSLAAAKQREFALEILDEIRLRILESVSEGGTYKLRDLAHEIKETLGTELANDKEFAQVFHDIGEKKRV